MNTKPVRHVNVESVQLLHIHDNSESKKKRHSIVVNKNMDDSALKRRAKQCIYVF